MTTGTCKNLGNQFNKNAPNQLVCSDECRASFFPSGYCKDLAKGTIGSIAELAVAAELLSSGYQVFRSLSTHAFCDLIAIKGTEFRKIEVRSGWFNRCGSLVYPKKHHPDATEFAVYVHADKSIHYISIAGVR